MLVLCTIKVEGLKFHLVVSVALSSPLWLLLLLDPILGVRFRSLLLRLFPLIVADDKSYFLCPITILMMEQKEAL